MRSDARSAVEAWEAAVNTHDLGAYARAVTDDYRWRLWDSSTEGRDVSLESWKLLFEAIPDIRITHFDWCVDGARVAARFRMSGTHTGPLRFRGTRSMERPIASTGKRFEVEGAAVFETAGGRVAAVQAYWQPSAMLAQLGVDPAALR